MGLEDPSEGRRGAIPVHANSDRGSSLGYWARPAPGHYEVCLVPRTKHGSVGRDLVAIKAYDPEADSKYVKALQDLKDLRSSKKMATKIPSRNVATTKVHGMFSAESPESEKSTFFPSGDGSPGGGDGFSTDAKIRTRGKIAEESQS
nr:hypothetical protein [Tanacetum cinerariifolium]